MRASPSILLPLLVALAPAHPAFAQDPVATPPTEDQPGGQAEDRSEDRSAAQGEADATDSPEVPVDMSASMGTPSDQVDLSLEQLLEISVTTATKSERTLGEAPAMIEVITGKEIRERGYRHIADVLQDLIGNHEDARNWGVGEPTYQNTGFGFRFDAGQNILFLFNGQRLNGFLWGSRFGGEEYLLDSIERIEVVRGPGSSLYGANAFTAVVNIVSKNSFQLDERPYARGAVGGSVHPEGGSVEGSWKTRVGHLGLLSGAIRLATDNGQELLVENDLFGDARLRDKLRHAYSADAFFSYKRFRAYGKLEHQERSVFTGVNGVSFEDDRLSLSVASYSLGADYTHSISDHIKLKVSGGGHYDDFYEVGLVPIIGEDPSGMPVLEEVTVERDGQTIMTPFLFDGVSVDTFTAEAEVQLTWNYRDKNNVILGVNGNFDWLLDPARMSEIQIEPFAFVPFQSFSDDANNFILDPNASRQTYGMYAQVDYDLADRLFLIAGARFDVYTGTGDLAETYNEFNPRGGIIYKDDVVGNLKLLFGSATRIPNVLEAMMKVVLAGDPDNRPERLRMFQASWAKNWSSHLKTELGGFYAVLSNHLVTDANISDEQAAAGFVGRYININEDLQNQGIEAKVLLKLSPVSLNVNATRYIGSDDGFGNEIPYIPMTMVNAGVTVPVWWLNLYVGANYRGGFTKPDYDPRPAVDDYVLLNSTVSFMPPSMPLKVRLGGRNLLDADIRAPSSSLDFRNQFPTRGIEVWGDVAYTVSF